MISNEFEKVRILGVNIATVNMTQLVNYVIEDIKVLSGKYICVTNVHALVTAFRDDNFKRIQNNAILAIPDGGPIATECRKRGFKNTKRTTGPDFMGEILKISENNSFSHFFYGSTNETLYKLRNEILSKYPKLRIAGMYSPPFRKLSSDEDLDIIKKINETNPDFVWVGLGAPKQEEWMAEHENKINGLMVGVGAAFDYFAGNIKRAPMIMQKLNLEWLYRLIQDPKRLFFRYFSTNFSYIWHANILKK